MKEQDARHRVTVSERLYAALLWLYPPAHRREYGPEMRQLFRDQCRAAARRGGGWCLVGLLARSLLDTASAAPAEQLYELRYGGHFAMDPNLFRRRHLQAVFVSGCPVLLAAVLTLLNPRYMGRMVMPSQGSAQPTGWLLTAGFVVLTGLAYLALRASIIRGERTPSARVRSAALYAGGVLFLLLPAFAVVFFGPAVVLLTEAGHLPGV